MPEPARNQTTLPPRLGLLLIGRLGAALATTPERRRRGQEGFSLLLVLIVALTVILGTLVIAGRANFGRQGSVFQMQSQEARAAAELGATWAISELNKVRNRPLLVTPYVAILCRDPPSSDGLNLVTATPGPERFILPDGSVLTTVPTNSSYESFQVVGVARPRKADLDITKDRDPSNRANSGTQPLVLRVEGRSYRNGVVVARTVLETEYEVVPKLSGRTFGAFGVPHHGDDDYNIPAGDPLCPAPLGPAVFDQVARSTNRFRFFGN